MSEPILCPADGTEAPKIAMLLCDASAAGRTDVDRACKIEFDCPTCGHRWTRWADRPEDPFEDQGAWPPLRPG